MRFTTKNKGIKNGKMCVGVKIESSFEDTFFRPTHYTAILRAMRDTDRDAFYEAMCDFVDSKEMTSVADWISKRGEGRDDDE